MSESAYGRSGGERTGGRARAGVRPPRARGREAGRERDGARERNAPHVALTRHGVGHREIRRRVHVEEDLIGIAPRRGVHANRLDLALPAARAQVAGVEVSLDRRAARRTIPGAQRLESHGEPLTATAASASAVSPALAQRAHQRRPARTANPMRARARRRGSSRAPREVRRARQCRAGHRPRLACPESSRRRPGRSRRRSARRKHSRSAAATRSMMRTPPTRSSPFDTPPNRVARPPAMIAPVQCAAAIIPWAASLHRAWRLRDPGEREHSHPLRPQRNLRTDHPTVSAVFAVRR